MVLAPFGKFSSKHGRLLPPFFTWCAEKILSHKLGQVEYSFPKPSDTFFGSEHLLWNSTFMYRSCFKPRRVCPESLISFFFHLESCYGSDGTIYHFFLENFSYIRNNVFYLVCLFNRRWYRDTYYAMNVEKRLISFHVFTVPIQPLLDFLIYVY